MSIRGWQKSVKRGVKTLSLWAVLISLLCGNAIMALAATTPTGVALEDIESIVDGVMSEKIGTIAPGASVVIVKDGEIIFCKGYGVSDIDVGTLVTGTETIFEIGSIAKLFTWTALMQLVEEGKVNLQDDIREYIGYDRLDLAFEKPIRVVDLMNHTAGFEENISEMMTFDKEKLIPLEDWISRNHQPKQVYEPGSTIAYSNFGTSIAGYIVQLQSGMKWEDYFQEYIFAPLDMNMSTAYSNYYHLPHILENKSKGYDTADGGGFELLSENYITDGPAGSIMATAEDMGRFMIAHMNYDETAQYSLFASGDTARGMHRDSLVTPGSMPANAHGFWTREESGVRLLEHGGNTTNFTALLSMVPEENFGICVLTNVNGESDGMRTDILAALSAGFNHEAKVSTGINRSVDLSGAYAAARTIKSSFLSIIYLLPEGLTVKDLGNGEIDVIIEGTPGRVPLRYAETEPYVFERTESVPSAMDKVGASMTHLQFIVDDSGAVQIVRTGNIVDYTSLPLHKNAALNRGIVIFCVAVFALSLVYGIIVRIMTRKKEKSEKCKSGMLLPAFGLLSFLNALISLMRVQSDFSAPISNYRIHLIANLLFAVGMAVSAVFMARALPNKEVAKKDKAVNVLLIIGGVLFIFWLCNYHLLAFWTI